LHGISTAHGPLDTVPLLYVSRYLPNGSPVCSICNRSVSVLCYCTLHVSIGKPWTTHEFADDAVEYEVVVVACDRVSQTIP
jgi:hypothetical protein